eukprot:5856799-Alexandrium_andersonii.AAC.1
MAPAVLRDGGTTLWGAGVRQPPHCLQETAPNDVGLSGDCCKRAWGVQETAPNVLGIAGQFIGRST